MITWRDVTPGHQVADIRYNAMAVVRLHAHPTRWEIEFLAGRIDGPAGSIGHAKRAALQALLEALPKLELDVQAALQRY